MSVWGEGILVIARQYVGLDDKINIHENSRPAPHTGSFNVATKVGIQSQKNGTHEKSNASKESFRFAVKQGHADNGVT